MSIKILPKERYYGNIEYKSCLIDIKGERLNKYATQLNFRIIEGKGTARYYLGIKDDGTLQGYTDINDVKDQIDICNMICKEINAIIVKYDIIIINDKYYAYCDIEREYQENNYVFF